LRTGAWSQRLRPLGQTVVRACAVWVWFSGCCAFVASMVVVNKHPVGFGPTASRLLSGCSANWAGDAVGCARLAPHRFREHLFAGCCGCPLGLYHLVAALVWLFCFDCVCLRSRLCLLAAPWPDGCGIGPRSRGFHVRVLPGSLWLGGEVFIDVVLSKSLAPLAQWLERWSYEP
jgi:hypothetical protein